MTTLGPSRPSSKSSSRPAPRAAPAVAKPDFEEKDPLTRVWVGDCRDVLPAIPDVAKGRVDLVFADPPFNWKRGYDRWNDDLPEREYLDFTYDWLDRCVAALRPGGAMWVNIPDDWAAEITAYLKSRMDRKPPAPMHMENWCIWHYRFGQNTRQRFINSKVHALRFVKAGGEHTWRPERILEASDRATTYFDPRTLSKKDGMPAGKRVPMDVWYGPFWGRIQGNNKERRHKHDNQLPEAYLARVVLSTSDPDDLVLDPFLGSGTTGVIARALGRRFIGVEYSRDNARRAWDRIMLGPVRPPEQPPPPSGIHRARSTSAATRRKFEGLA